MTTRTHTRTALALAAAILAVAPAAAQARVVQGSGASPSGSVNTVGRTGEDVRLGTQMGPHRSSSFAAQAARTGEDARLVAVPHQVQAVRDFPGDYRPATIPATAFTSPSVASKDSGFNWTGGLILTMIAGAVLLVLIAGNRLLTGATRRVAHSS